MKKNILTKKICSLLACSGIALSAFSQTWQSNLVKFGSNGKLTYTTDANQNSIPDFSYAGYKNNDKEIPQATKILASLSPQAGDNTNYINNAIAAAASAPLDANGVRGVILLAKGNYQIAGTIRVNVSGVVLRGAGSTSDPNVSTIFQATGNTPDHRTVVLAGGGSASGWNQSGSYQANITDNFVKVGAREFTVSSVAGLQAGDNIIIYSPCTSAWISAVGGGGTAGAPDWTVNSQPLIFNRTVKAINGNKVTIDAPVFNHLNKNLAQAYIYKADRSSLRTQIGLENFRIDIRNWTNQDVDESHAWEGVGFLQAEDCWAKNVVALHFGHAGFRFNTAARITVDNCKALEPVATIEPERRYNFNFEDRSTSILIKNCEANKARHAFVSNGTSSVSGIVILRCTANDNYTSSEGHRRWSMGMLFDNFTTGGNIPSDSRVLGLYSRGNYGTSHGWALAHSVAWNCNFTNGGSVTVQQPPTAQNYVIGGYGKVNTSVPFPQYPNGYVEGFSRTDGKTLLPTSLFDQQLLDRHTPANQPPVVSITAPANNTSLQEPATIVITAAATDADGTISKVEFFNGTIKLGESTTAPYSFAWNTIAAGNYTLTVKATDNAGAITTSSAVVLIVNPLPPCEPVKASSDDGNIPANVLDNNFATRWSANGDGQWIQFCQQTAQPISGIQIAFYSGNTRQQIFDVQTSNDGLNWTNVLTNMHSSGTSTQLESFSFTQQNVKFIRILGHGNTVNTWNSITEVKLGLQNNPPPVNQFPTVTITSPVSNASYNAPASVTINASASDADGTVSKVEFFNGVTKLGEDLSAPYSFSWTNVAAGTYTITTKATDNAGAVTTSAALTIKVNTVVTNGCTGIPSYVENGGYVAGSKVQYGGVVYQCKDYPYSGWCNGAAWAYGPGAGTNWSDAWTRVMNCNGARLGEADAMDSKSYLVTSLNSVPNPFSAATKVEVTIAEAGEVSLEVFDNTGFSVQVLYKGYLDAGTYSYEFDSKNLKSELYLVKLNSNQQVLTKKIVKSE